jgi:hypothetical protein
LTEEKVLRPGIDKYVAEVRALREQLSSPGIEATITELHEHLVRTRSVLDRVDYITMRLRFLLGGARLNLREAQALLTDAEDEVYRRSNFDQYMPGRQRDAFVAGKTVAQTSVVRSAELLSGELETAFEVCTLVRWYVDGMRREVDTRMKLATFERSLER